MVTGGSSRDAEAAGIRTEGVGGEGVGADVSDGIVCDVGAVGVDVDRDAGVEVAVDVGAGVEVVVDVGAGVEVAVDVGAGAGDGDRHTEGELSI